LSQLIVFIKLPTIAILGILTTYKL